MAKIEIRNKTKFRETEIGKIPEGWEETTLGAVTTFQRGYDLPLKNRKDGPYPIVMSNGIGGYHNEFKVNGPGVTIGRSGNLGEPFYSDKDYWPHNTTLYIKRFNNAYPKFMYYFLKGLRLNRFNAGSAVPTLNRNHIHPIPIIFPIKINEQKAITKILSDLDEKIELNNQTNKTFEAIGQALFKRWFVEFEFPCLPPGYLPARGSQATALGAGKPDDFEQICNYKSVGGVPAHGKFVLFFSPLIRYGNFLSF